MIRVLLVLILSVTFGVSPAFVTSFQGFDPNLYPVPQADPPVQPAGWAFAIWGPLYAWLLVSALFGIWARREAADWQRMRAPLAGSLAIGTFWLWAAEQSPVLATMMIWAMLVLALAAMISAPTARDGWAARQPVAAYAGWLTAASCAALGLLGAGWGVGPGEVGWGWIGAGLATGIGAAIQLSQPGTPAYGIAVTWALTAIAAKNASAQPALAAAAGLAAILMLALAALSWKRGTASPP